MCNNMLIVYTYNVFIRAASQTDKNFKQNKQRVKSWPALLLQMKHPCSCLEKYTWNNTAWKVQQEIEKTVHMGISSVL